MVQSQYQPTGRERFFDPDEIIVSKTDPKGILTYANSVFLRIAGYSEQEILGANHNIIRHPDMPRCVFKLLWETIASGEEIFAYVVNLAKGGDHYWVWAHVTPSFDDLGTITGYHSSRRVPERSAVEKARGLYAQLREIERQHGDSSESLEASLAELRSLLGEARMEYDEFAFSL